MVPEPDEVHLWHIQLDALQAAVDALASFEAVLDSDEAARRAAFRHALTRDRFTVAHGALRLILGNYLSLPATRIRLRRSDLGKPELDLPGSEVRFNLTHAGGHALVAVTTRGAVGVDLEFPRAGFPLKAFTRRYFPAVEHELVLSAPPAERMRIFLRLWTRKEAVVKAAGSRMARGTALPVHGTDDQILVRVASGPLRGTWSAQDFDCAAGIAALAVASETPCRLAHFTWTPELFGR